MIKLIIEQINVCVGSNSFRNDSNHCQFVRVTSINYILITFHLKACTYCIVLSPRTPFMVQFEPASDLSPTKYCSIRFHEAVCVYSFLK